MKKTLLILIVCNLLACSQAKETEKQTTFEIVCADSVEQELFDENGNSYTVKVAGKCDTIVASKE